MTVGHSDEEAPANVQGLSLIFAYV